jgi:hypothetical protein
VKLIGQLIGGELAEPAGTGTRAAGGELADGGHLGPGDPGFQPLRGGDDAHQLVIGQGGQVGAAVTGEGVHHGGQQRSGCHRVRLAILHEPSHI